MKRLSYLQQVAPQPPATRRGGFVLLSPPRLVFRPSATAPDFVVLEGRPVASAAGPLRPIEQPAPRAASSAGPMPHAGSSTVGVARPSRQAEQSDLARPVRQPTPPATIPVRPRQDAARGLAPGDAGSGEVGRAVPEPRQPSLPVATRRASEQVSPAGGPVPRIAAPAAEAIRQPSAPVVATRRDIEAMSGSPQAQVVERARTMPPLLNPSHAEPGTPQAVHRAFSGTLSAPPPDVPNPPAAPRHDRVTPKAALPVVTPPPAPPRPPMPPSARERVASGLHIGTLEVRVVAPSTPPVSATTMPRTAPRQGAVRATPGRTDRIARGFGVFGLGQS
jgi:hypothetical protein